MNASSYFVAGSSLIIGGLVGALLFAWWLRRQSNAVMRMPSKWPLKPRVTMTQEEYEVFKWIKGVFDDHFIMVKLPVLRFTAPVNKDKNGGGKRWQDMLGGVYCTFSVCTPNGHVVGCVDVPGKRGLSKLNRDLKESLLADCHVPYTSVRSGKFPRGGAIRAAFLGEVDVDSRSEAQITQAGDSSFNADLDSFAKEKKRAAQAAAMVELNKNNAQKTAETHQASGFNPDGTGAFDANRSGRFRTKWDDSFMSPDDSRPSKLH